MNPLIEQLISKQAQIDITKNLYKSLISEIAEIRKKIAEEIDPDSDETELINETLKRAKLIGKKK